MFSRIASAAALLAIVSRTAAQGNATVKNVCSYPVYLWSVSNEVNPMVMLEPGAFYTEQYRSNPDGGGISIKIGTSSNSLWDTANNGGITQFEYTLSSDIWFDISNINGADGSYPFVNQGLALKPSLSSCPSVTCPPGVALCSQVYNVPTDNYATAACANSADTVLALCTDNTADATVDGAPNVADASSTVSVIFASATSSSSTSTTTTTKTTTIVTSAVSTFSNPFVSVTDSSTYVVTPSAVASETPVAIVSPVTTDASATQPVFTTFVTHVVTVEAAPPSTTTAPSTTAAPTTAPVSSSKSTKDFYWVGHHPISWDGLPNQKRHVHHHAHGAHHA